MQIDATLFAKSSHHFCMLHMHVASNCTHCCMLLGIAVQSLKPVKLLAMCKGKQQLLGVIGQQCCAHFARALKL